MNTKPDRDPDAFFWIQPDLYYSKDEVKERLVDALADALVARYESEETNR